MVQVNRLTKTNFICKMLPALAFLLSWAVSLGGFWQLMLNYQVDPEKQEEGDSGNNEPSIFTTLEKRYFFTHYYIGLFMRPVLLLTGFLHLCTCRACSLTGPYSTTFGVSYFMIEGHIAYTIVQTILDRKDDPDTVRVYLGLSLADTDWGDSTGHQLGSYHDGKSPSTKSAGRTGQTRETEPQREENTITRSCQEASHSLHPTLCSHLAAACFSHTCKVQ